MTFCWMYLTFALTAVPTPSAAAQYSNIFRSIVSHTQICVPSKILSNVSSQYISKSGDGDGAGQTLNYFDIPSNPSVSHS